jgi:putative transposase
MEKLGTSYSMYFNLKNKRPGALFQGKFKAQHVTYDEYLNYLYAYIHLNPVKMVDQGWGRRRLEDKAASKNYLENYPYSSYMDHAGVKREESVILSPKEFPEYFSRSSDFEKYVEEWMTPPEVS